MKAFKTRLIQILYKQSAIHLPIPFGAKIASSSALCVASLDGSIPLIRSFFLFPLDSNSNHKPTYLKTLASTPKPVLSTYGSCATVHVGIGAGIWHDNHLLRYD